MAVTTVTYNYSKPYVGPSRQPLADVTLISPSTRFSIASVLVDTGADFLQVPASAATNAGLSLSAGTSTRVRTVGGIVHMTLLVNVSVEVEGVSITTDVLCHPNAKSRPLLGRKALVALRNVGFDPQEWLW
jgi:predicted aspartyl protease